MNIVFSHMQRMLPFMIAAIPLTIIIRLISYPINKKRGIRTTVLHETALLLFIVFLAGLISQTILPRIEIEWPDIVIINTKVESSFNFVPGKIISVSLDYLSKGKMNYFILNFLGNICFFIPIGLMIPLIWRCSFRKTVLIGFLCSLSIELIQIPLPRCTDIDDLWMNTLGALIGALIYLLVNRLLPEFTGKCKVRLPKQAEPDRISA